jgi:DNA repair protein RadD
MNRNLEILYNILKPRIDKFLAQPVLGDTVAIGIERYFQLQSDLTGKEIDYAEIIVDSLDKNILTNKCFVELFVKQIINEEDIKSLSQILKISEGLTIIKKRKEIIEKSNSSIKMAIIKHYKLEEDFFANKDNLKTTTTETIVPFNPVPIEEDNCKELIHREFLSLHDYQKHIKDSLIQKLIFTQPNAKILVHMPTGSGKTKTAVEAMVDFIRVSLRTNGDGGTIVWFAHSNELCEQAYQAFKAIWKYKGDFPINAYKYFGDCDINELDKCQKDKISIIFAGFQKFNTLYNANHTSKQAFLLKNFLHTNTKLVIVDEAHKSLANTYKKAIEFVSSMPNCRLVGLTATPGRSNFIDGDNSNHSLSDFFGHDIISICDKTGSKLKDPLKYLQREKVLAEIDFEELDFNINLEEYGYNKSKIHNISKKDLGKAELNIISTDPIRNSIILNKIKECFLLNESILVFACSKEHCIILQRLLKTIEIESIVILGETNKDIRFNAIKRFKNKELKILINYGVLSTGFDAPKLNTLIMARPTNSIVLYSQIVGRALRGPKNGGNSRNKIITIKDNMVGFPSPDFMFSYWKDFWN